MSHSLPTDLVLVNPGARTAIYQSLGKRLTAVENPVWAGLIATFVRRHGYEVQIVDAEADELAPSQIAERVAAINPRCRRRRLRPSAIGLHAEHDRSEPRVHRDPSAHA